jgi:hypothetical protein
MHRAETVEHREYWYDRQRRHHRRTAISDGGPIHWRHNAAADVRERSGDMPPVVSHRTVGIHGGMDESARGQHTAYGLAAEFAGCQNAADIAPRPILTPLRTSGVQCHRLPATPFNASG